MFCNGFDEALASQGPAAVFLRDDEGAWRLAPNWTRDAWQRDPGPHDLDWRYVLLRDRDTGFVTLALSTSPTLLAAHPRCDVRAHADLDAALTALTALGRPPLDRDPWDAP